MSQFSHDKKQPLKRLEIPLNKFNEVAIPHHVDLLKKHKSNIQRLQKERKWDQVHHEQINATRLVKQLKGSLYEIEILRNQVDEKEWTKFDKLTYESQQSALSAIKEYIDLIPQNTFIRTENEPKDEENLISLQVDLDQANLASKEESLKSFEELQQAIHETKELYEEFAKIVKDQQENINQIEENTEISLINVNEGTQTLKKITLYKTAMYPVAGAFIGGCLGGPVGLLAGLKMGGLAAFGFGALGFTGGRILKKKLEEVSTVKEPILNESMSKSYLNEQAHQKYQ